VELCIHKVDFLSKICLVSLFRLLCHGAAIRQHNKKRKIFGSSNTEPKVLRH